MKHIIVYTQPGCGACQAEKAWLNEKGVAFEERNIRENSVWLQELVELGSRGTPTTVIREGEGEENQVLIGFDSKKLSLNLNI